MAWVVRCGLFALGASEVVVMFVYIGLALHGFCWNFFFVTGFMYTDEKAGPEIKGQAQGLLMLFSQGIGVFLGSIVTGHLFNITITKQGTGALHQWGYFWTYSIAGAIVITLLFVLLFKRREKSSITVGTVNIRKVSNS